MKPNASFPRRTALAIAAASVGLTLAVSATIAVTLGLVAPAPSAPAIRTGGEQPAQPLPVPVMTDGFASAPIGSGEPSTATGATARATVADDVRLARREHDDDDDRKKVRRPSATRASV